MAISATKNSQNANSNTSGNTSPESSKPEAKKPSKRERFLSVSDENILSSNSSNLEDFRKNSSQNAACVPTNELLGILTEYRMILKKWITRLNNVEKQQLQAAGGSSNMAGAMTMTANKNNASNLSAPVTDFSPITNSARFTQHLKIYLYSQFRAVKSKYTTDLPGANRNHNLPHARTHPHVPMSNHNQGNQGIAPAQGLWYINDISRIFTLPNRHFGRRSNNAPVYYTTPASVYERIIDFNVQKILQENGVINYLRRGLLST